MPIVVMSILRAEVVTCDSGIGSKVCRVYLNRDLLSNCEDVLPECEYFGYLTWFLTVGVGCESILCCALSMPGGL